MSELCWWSEDDGGEYTTKCGNNFFFHNGTPIENGFVFCPFCGKKVEQTLYEDPHD